MQFSLVPCTADGKPIKPIATVPEAVAANYAATAELYRRVSFVEPWISYIAVDRDQAVGGGAFVGPPRDNRVEIAYYTVKELEGRGYGTQTAAQLLRIARSCEPKVAVCAFTLQEQNASTKILQRLGFTLFGNARDRDAGDVWEWRT
jgi:RimJ/RimL family protein N-acetyltransferase